MGPRFRLIPESHWRMSGLGATGFSRFLGIAPGSISPGLDSAGFPGFLWAADGSISSSTLEGEIDPLLEL